MAIVRAVKSGNWSDTTVWNTGALPTSADDVYSNTFTVTIDISPTVLQISNAAATGVTAGGSFVPTNGITLSCTGAGVVGASGTMITSTLVAGQSFSIVGSVSQIASGTCINNNGNGGINIIGAVNHTSSSNVSYTIVNSTLGSITITGNVTSSGNYFSSNNAVRNIGNGVVSITGDVRNTNAQDTCNNAGAGTMNITGNVFGGPSSQGTSVLNSGIMPIVGNLTGGSATSAVENGGTLTHSGTATASNNVPALISSSASAVNILSGPFLVSANGTHAVYAARWFWQNASPSPTYYQIRSADLSTIRPLYTADSVGGNPAITNVRLGTVYGPSNELTGSVAIPPAQSVTFGVPVDNTTGTSALTPDSIWNYPVSGITTSGSIGERLKNAATVNTVAKQISDAFSGPYT